MAHDIQQMINNNTHGIRNTVKTSIKYKKFTKNMKFMAKKYCIYFEIELLFFFTILNCHTYITWV